ncbi:hypothetical protein SMD44_08428 [Streptomyces alboflavus]|uniref:Uncharacterized protein n=1 Tax=Streptomyces alboflavus TaxID=67267 RepID=A0A1Z1WR57_9ACTN|nr:hypothetical protein SMD44_08428 [Streptomyces alboflavus]
MNFVMGLAIPASFTFLARSLTNFCWARL